MALQKIVVQSEGRNPNLANKGVGFVAVREAMSEVYVLHIEMKNKHQRKLPTYDHHTKQSKIFQQEYRTESVRIHVPLPQ